MQNRPRRAAANVEHLYRLHGTVRSCGQHERQSVRVSRATQSTDDGPARRGLVEILRLPRLQIVRSDREAVRTGSLGKIDLAAVERPVALQSAEAPAPLDDGLECLATAQIHDEQPGPALGIPAAEQQRSTVRRPPEPLDEREPGRM